MSRVKGLADDELGDLMDVLGAGAEILGFVPNSQRIMAHKPEVLRGLVQLANAIYNPETSLLPPSLKTLISLASSLAGGCMYCVAHTSSTSGRVGVDEAKIAAISSSQNNGLPSQRELSKAESSGANVLALSFCLASAKMASSVSLSSSRCSLRSLLSQLSPTSLISLASRLSVATINRPGAPAPIRANNSQELASSKCASLTASTVGPS